VVKSHGGERYGAKGEAGLCQVSAMETNENESL